MLRKLDLWLCVANMFWMVPILGWWCYFFWASLVISFWSSVWHCSNIRVFEEFVRHVLCCDLSPYAVWVQEVLCMTGGSQKNSKGCRGVVCWIPVAQKLYLESSHRTTRGSACQVLHGPIVSDATRSFGSLCSFPQRIEVERMDLSNCGPSTLQCLYRCKF